MWDRLIILFALMCMAVGAPLLAVPCPEPCECIVLKSGHMKASCSSQHFLDELQSKQMNAIIFLDLSNQNITKLSPHLKKLHNLKSVNLSNNQISDVHALNNLPKLTYLNVNTNHIKSFIDLPTSLKYIDLSNNYLTYIPSKINALKSLKELNLNNNPMSCDCDTLYVRDQLLKQEVSLNKEVYCHSPKLLKGQTLLSAVCEFDLNRMQGDEAIEGSGEFGEASTEANETDVFDDINTSNNTDIQDEELIPQLPKEVLTQKETTGDNDDQDEEEGSGDVFGVSTTEAPAEDSDYDYEGSGDDIESTIIPIYVHELGRPRGCMLSNCSMPSNENDTEDTSPAPGIIDGFNILYEDITGNNPKTTEVPEEELAKEEDLVVPTESDTDKIVPVVAIDLGTENVRSHEANKKSEDIQLETQKSSLNTTFIVVAALLAIMVGLIIYSVMKRRNSHRRKLALSDLNNSGSEMKPLKHDNTITNDTITNGSNGGGHLYEKVPLMNGKNGKAAEDPILSDQSDDLDSRIPYADEQDDEVEMRHKNDDDSLLPPETQRVTIKVTELSTPKTPLLVNRQRTGDGLIITTPSEQSL